MHPADAKIRAFRCIRRREFCSNDGRITKTTQNICPTIVSRWSGALYAIPVGGALLASGRAGFAPIIRLMSLEQFHPTIHRWFSERFGEPTEPQREGWPRI